MDLNRLRWISEDRANRLLAKGFWRFVIFRGLLSFGVWGVLGVSVLGYLRGGTSTFFTAWWRNGVIAFLIAGIVWALLVWLTLRLPAWLREIVCWGVLMIAIALVISIFFPHVIPAGFGLL